MDNNAFITLIQDTLLFLESDAKAHPQLYTKGGESFELLVLGALNEVKSNLNTGIEIEHNLGGHAFPDIVIKSDTGEKYGIEVKSSITKGDSWKINGNSVLGSTSKPGILKNVIIFGKLRLNECQFRAKDYEKSIANVVVTHSPRYFIDLDLEDGATFFDKSNIPYRDLVINEDPIGLITDYFHSQGHKAWWLSTSTPAAIRLFGELSYDEKSELIGYGFVHFPEIMSRSNTKFSRFVSWLVTENSIIDASLRDRFTAGGIVDLYVSGNKYNRLPRIFKKMHQYRAPILEELENCDQNILQDDWNCSVPSTAEGRKTKWIKLVSKVINKDDIPNTQAKELLRNIIED
jgi:hypothetical protein